MFFAFMLISIGTFQNYSKYAHYAGLPFAGTPSYFTHTHIDELRNDHFLVFEWSFESLYLDKNLKIFSTRDEPEKYSYTINNVAFTPEWIPTKHPTTKQLGKTSVIQLDSIEKGIVELIIKGETKAHWREGNFKWEKKFSFIKE